MPQLYNFPVGDKEVGHEVLVYRKEDILECIRKNITDADVALKLIAQCEIDANEIAMNGGWAAIPYMGNIRIPKHRQLMLYPEQQQLLEEASQELDANRYIAFRRALTADNIIFEKRERYHNYVTAKLIGKNKKVYNNISSQKGELFAKIFFYTLINIDQYGDSYLDNL